MQNLDKCIDMLFENGTVHNIAVKAVCGGEAVCEVYRSDCKTPNEHTKFDMASVTKILSPTMLFLIAWDKGLISPQTRVSEFYECSEDKKSLTLENLLTHTMGIGHKNLCAEGNTGENIAEYILNIDPDIAAGSDVLYSCPAFILLGKIMEKVYNMRLDAAFDKYVAAPLGLSDTGYLPDGGEFVNSNIRSDESGIVNDYNCRFLGGVCGNAGIFSSMADMTKYAEMLLRSGAPLIGRDTFLAAAKNYTPEMSESRGLGFVYVDSRYTQTGNLFADGAIGHCGHAGQSVFADIKKQMYVIILSDATVSTAKKYGIENYDEVMKMRCDIHNALCEE